MQLIKTSGAKPMLAAFGLMLAGGMGSAQAQAPAKVWPTDLVNVAAAANGGRVVKSTSVFEGDTKWAAENLIDGQAYNPAKSSGSFGWASGKYDPIKMESVTIGFADNKIRRIGRIVINPASNMIPERWAKDIAVEAATESADGPWRSVAELTLRRDPVPQSFIILPAEARFVRFNFRSNHGSDVNVALGEIEMYEAINTDDPLGSMIGRLEQTISELKNYRAAQEQLGGAGIPNAANRKANANGEGAVPANIAAAANGGKIVGHSSIFENNQAYTPNNLIDGKNFNRENNSGSFGWASEGFDPGREFVTIGFRDDRTKVINRIIINPVSNQSTLRWARSIDVQVTSDSPKQGPWRSVATINLRYGRGEDRNQDFPIRPVEAKYVRFVFLANGPSDIDLPGVKPGVNSDRAVSLGEIEIYEISDSTKVLDALIGRFEGILADLKRLNAADEAKLAANSKKGTSKR